MTGPGGEAARRRLFVALDVAEVEVARRLVGTLGDSVEAYKLGLEILFGGGLGLALELKRAGFSIFLDMKLLDIANTVERAAANIAAMGLDFLTVHAADRKTLDAAVRGRGSSKLKLLGVTVLTNLTEPDLREQGIVGMDPGELVVHRARLAREAGFDGVIASGREAALVQGAVPRDFLIITPGIRLPGGEAGDQARVTTPEAAIAQGATHLVVGRPITEAADPRAVANEIVRRIATARPAS